MMNIEKARERNRKWYWRDPEKVRALKRANSSKWQKLNPERRREIYRRWYYRHREEFLPKKNAARREKHKLLTAEEKNKKAMAYREWRSRNGRHIQQRRLARYDLTIEQFESLLKEQGGACAICRSTKFGPKNWHVDHDHKTGRVRGLLCHNCNLAIGLMKDNPKQLHEAAHYLEKTRI